MSIRTNRSVAKKHAETTFWHLSDLHLEACDRQCQKSDPACHACIKAKLIGRLAGDLEHGAPALLLFGGDIFDDDSYKRHDHSLAPLLAAAKRCGTEVVGVRGQHDAEDLDRTFTWVLKEGGTNERTGVFVRALPAGKVGKTAPERAARTLRALKDAEPHPGGRPSVLLAHINAAAFPGWERKNPRFHYYALGDMHLSRIVDLGDARVLGTPGHVFPYFDGSGKVWPTFMLKGTISDSGRVHVRRVALQEAPYRAPHTRQLYIEHKYRDRADGELVLVNAPPNSVLKRAGLRSSAEEELETSGRGGQDITLRRVTFAYRSRRALEVLVRTLLEAMPNDIFVGLARGRGIAGERRKAYASHILRSASVPAFVEECFMRTSKTQTSDHEGWAASRGR